MCESASRRFQPGEGLVGAFSVITNLRMELFELDSGQWDHVSVGGSVAVAAPWTSSSPGRGLGAPSLDLLEPVSADKSAQMMHYVE